MLLGSQQLLGFLKTLPFILMSVPSSCCRWQSVRKVGLGLPFRTHIPQERPETAVLLSGWVREQCSVGPKGLVSKVAVVCLLKHCHNRELASFLGSHLGTILKIRKGFW